MTLPILHVKSQEFESLLSKVLSDEFKMETPMNMKIRSNIDILMKSESDLREALETLVSHLKHKVYIIANYSSKLLWAELF